MALYKKYRPTTFEDMIGQEGVVTTLINQIKSERIGHAYLFVGSRGTGKTTAAKILARAINCLGDSVKKTHPCGVCKACKQLNESNIDIQEIDAASNNSVEDIRTLRQNVNFVPTVAKYKVYIIDEVHMLSQGAFNALLKTLEEPPAHAVFILATTEPQRLPQTIISRCMRWDFRLYERPILSKFFGDICKKENKKIDKEALDYIAMRAEGSVRDGLSLLDTVFAFSDSVTLDGVLAILGTINKEYLYDLIDCMSSGDIASIFLKIDNIVSSGKSLSVVAKDIVSLCRDMAVSKVAKSLNKIIVGTVQDIKTLQERASKHSKEWLLSLVVAFSSIDYELRHSLSPRALFEVTAINASMSGSVDMLSISHRLDRLQESVESGGLIDTQKKTKNLDKELNYRNNEKKDNANNINLNNNIDSANDNNINNNGDSATKIQSTAIEFEPNNKLCPTNDDNNYDIELDFEQPPPKNELNNELNNEPKNELNNELNIDKVLGKLVGGLRARGAMSMYNLLANYDSNNYSIVDDKFVVVCNDVNYKEWASQIATDSINRAMKDCGFSLSLQLKQQKKINLDKEIDKIKKTIGTTVPFEIIK